MHRCLLGAVLPVFAFIPKSPRAVWFSSWSTKAWDSDSKKSRNRWALSWSVLTAWTKPSTAAHAAWSLAMPTRGYFAHLFISRSLDISLVISATFYFFAWSFVSIPFLLPVLSRTPAQDDLGPRPFCLQLVCFSFFFGKVFFVLSLPSFFGIVLIIKITCNVLFCWNLLFCFWCPGLGLKWCTWKMWATCAAVKSLHGEGRRLHILWTSFVLSGRGWAVAISTK